MALTEFVGQDAAASQEPIDRLEDAEMIAAIERGLDDVDNGRVIALEEAAARLRSKY